MRDDEYSEYIDNEQICMKEGVPCRHGIPDCNNCLTANAKEPVIIGPPYLIGRDAEIAIMPMPILIDHWFPMPECKEGPKLDISHLIRPVTIKKVKNNERK